MLHAAAHAERAVSGCFSVCRLSLFYLVEPYRLKFTYGTRVPILHSGDQKETYRCLPSKG